MTGIEFTLPLVKKSSTDDDEKTESPEESSSPSGLVANENRYE